MEPEGGNLHRSCSTVHNHRLGPPLTAIDRFLCGQQNSCHFPDNQTHTQTQTQNNAMIKDREALLGSPNGLSAFSSCSGGAIGAYNYENNLYWQPGTQDALLPNSCFVDGRNSNEQGTIMRGSSKSTSKGIGKLRAAKKSASAASLIKGRWTEEEDRKLIKLVKQYGVRKWAQIAEKLDGRAGKQCRERWHNHLRPDIKKDSWSEEEERILVEAHATVGNRWAEIAKKIPRRTENSIKNHWNATKRRQISRRKKKTSTPNKHKANINNKPQSSVLQDYIRSKALNTTINNSRSAVASTATTTTTPASSTLSEDYVPLTQFNYYFPELSESTTTVTADDSPPPLIPETYDEELVFMQNFYANQNHQPSNIIIQHDDDHHDHEKQLLTGITQCGFFFSSTANQNFSINGLQAHHESGGTHHSSHLYSDLYLSHLLNGTSPSSTSSSSIDYLYTNLESNMNFLVDHHHHQALSNGRKEMDLVEMVSSSSHRFVS